MNSWVLDLESHLFKIIHQILIKDPLSPLQAVPVPVVRNIFNLNLLLRLDRLLHSGEATHLHRHGLRLRLQNPCRQSLALLVLRTLPLLDLWFPKLALE